MPNSMFVSGIKIAQYNEMQINRDLNAYIIAKAAG